MKGSRRWARRGIEDAAYQALAEGLPASEVWSLLLDVLAQRAARRRGSDVLGQWRRDAFTRTARVDQRALHTLDGHLLANAAAFEAVELSPLAPLGSCAAVAPTSQNKIVSALRGTEVVADPTNVLALECAERLRHDPAATVRLCTSHRCVRAQPVPKGTGFAQHFRIFCMATAGRERKDHAFVAEALTEQVRTHLSALERLERHGYTFPDRTVELRATPARAALADRIAEGLSGVDVVRSGLEHPYYGGLRFTIGIATRDAEAAIPMIDGGSFDWLARLTSNRRLVFVASGMGSQLFAELYPPPES
jgi:hypothetical protein